MPRQPIFDEPLTPAERARRYRASRKVAASYGRLAADDPEAASRVSDHALVDTLRACLTDRDRRNGLRVLSILRERVESFEDQVDAFDP